MEASFDWGYLGYFAYSEASLMSKLPSQGKGIRLRRSHQKNKVREFYKSLSVIVIPASGGALVTTGKVYEVAANPIPSFVSKTKMAPFQSLEQGPMQMAQPDVNLASRSF